MVRKKTVKTVKKTAKQKAPKVQVYKGSSEPEKKPSKGYIKHPWYKLVAAAIVATLLGWLLRRRK